MEIKKILLLLCMIGVITLPWYKKYVYTVFYKYVKRHCSLIDLDCLRDTNKLNICNESDFDELIKIISYYDKSLRSVYTLDEDDQFILYKDLINNYVIDPFLVEKYLEDNNLMIDAAFMKDRDMYMKVMQNNFHINFFKNHLYKSITVKDDYASEYYESNKLNEFNKFPFVKSIASVDARIVKMENRSKSDDDYKKMLLKEQLCIPLVEYNPYERDSELSRVLLRMANDSYEVLVLGDGERYMVYKLKETAGDWHSYATVKQHIKKYLHDKLVQKEVNKIITEMKEGCSIKVCDSILKKYITEKKGARTQGSNYDTITESQQSFLEVGGEDTLSEKEEGMIGEIQENQT